MIPIKLCSQPQHQKQSDAQTDTPRNLEGDEAQAYLEKTVEGQSLMKELEAQRFGLKWQNHAPFADTTGAGYLGFSHDENLNAWFNDDGITIRPTLSEKEKEMAWRLDLRLKSYGYGSELTAAPPIVARRVDGNRIEYERRDCQFPIADCRFEKLGSLDSSILKWQLAIGNRH